MHHGEREGAKEVYILPGRGGALASHGVRRRRRHDDGKGWTVGEIPTWGGRYLKYRPPPGSLSAVGSGTCGPDRALCCTGSDSDVLVSSQGGAGAGWRLAGGRTPRRRCLNSVASVRRPTEWETPPLHHSRQRQARPINWPGQAGREIGRSAGFGRCAATGSNHVAVFAVARLPPDQVRYAWVPTTMDHRGQADC